MTTVALRASGTQAIGPVNTTLNPGIPAATAAGDVMVMVVAIGTNQVSDWSPFAPSGWTYIGAVVGSGVGEAGAAYYKVAGASESTPNFTTSGFTGGTIGCQIFSFTGVDHVNPILAVSGNHSSAGDTTVTAKSNSATPRKTGHMCLTLVTQNGAVGHFNAATGAFTSVLQATLDVAGGGTSQIGAVYTSTGGTIGTASNVTANYSTSTLMQLLTVELNPADGVVVTGETSYTTGGTNPRTISNNGTTGGGSGLGGIVFLAQHATVTSGVASVSALNGWTQIYATAVGLTTFGLFYRYVTAADLAASGDLTYNYTCPAWAGTGVSVAVPDALAVLGGATSSPIVGQGQTSYAAATNSFGLPSIAVSTGASLLLAIGEMSGSVTTITGDVALTTRQSNATAAQYMGTAAGPASPGSTTTYTLATTGTARTGSSMVVAIANGWTPPAAPTLTAPVNASYSDLAASGGPFQWSTNPGFLLDAQSAYAMRRKISGAPSYEYWNAGTSAWQSTIVWNTTTATSLTFGAGLWTDGNIYNWSVATQGGGATGNNQGPFASDFTVTASAPPTVTVNTPTGTLTSASPTVSWTDTLQSGASQISYQVVVESGAYGTTPGSGITFLDTGVVSSASTSLAVPGLANNTPYRFFVQVAETGGQLSPWGFSTATTSFDAPATPSLIAVWDWTLARCALTVQGHDNLLTANQSSIETDTTGWQVKANCAIARSTAQALDGSSSLRLTSIAAGAMSSSINLPDSNGAVVVAGRTYTIPASFRAAVSSRSVRVVVDWYSAASGGFLSTSTGASVTDNTTGWTQAKVTAVAPVGATHADVYVEVLATAAANEVHYVDQIGVFPDPLSNFATWTIGGIAATGSYIIEASEDGGTTWNAIRGSGSFVVDSAANQQIIAYDYERTPGATVLYRARVTDGASPQTITSLNSPTAQIVVDMISWWVKDINNPAFNMALCDAQQNVRNKKGDSVAVYPAGRTNPIVLRGPVHGADGSFRTVVKTETDRTTALKLFTAQDSLLIQDPRGRQWYAEWVGDFTETPLQVDQPYYALQRGWVEVDVPS